MKKVIDYIRSVVFSLSYSFRYAAITTVIMLLFYVVYGVLPYVSSFLLGKLVDGIIYGIQSGESSILLLLFLYSFSNAATGILGNIQLYIARIRILTLQTEIELDFLRRRESFDISQYEDPKFRDLEQRALRQNSNPIFQLSYSIFDLTRSIVGIIVGTFLAFHFSPVIYLVVILTALPVFLVDIKFAGASWSIYSKDSPSQRRLNDLRGHLVQKIDLIETKLLQSSNKILGMIRRLFFDFNQKQLKLEKSRLLSTTVTDVLSLAGYTFGLYLIVKSVINGEYKVGTLVYMMTTLSTVKTSINNFLINISTQYENNLIVKDIITLFNTKPDVVQPENPVSLNLNSAPEIVFENIGFKYVNSDKWSLRNINLTLKAGDNIGLVGNNGAGKTTLVKLLCRIYDPTEGKITINGIDLKDVSTKEWWSYLAVMFQDYSTYDFVVEDAIAMGKPDKITNLTKVIDASKISQSHDFIMDWDDKYKQQLGVEFGGKEPSKGQRQKLSIAKILYRDGFIMVLDEPTASVDAESESKIFDSIENLPKDRTAILISHDFSTISACDKIFVLDKGSLIEEGTHKELMKNKGMYSELYKLQADRFKK